MIDAPQWRPGMTTISIDDNRCSFNGKDQQTTPDNGGTMVKYQQLKPLPQSLFFDRVIMTSVPVLQGVNQSCSLDIIIGDKSMISSMDDYNRLFDIIFSTEVTNNL
jgi:hypothetical protein